MSGNEFVIVVGLDIERYSEKSLSLQHFSQKLTERWIIHATKTSGIADKVEDIRWIDTGDGGFLLVEGQYGLAISFIKAFYKELNDHEKTSRQESRIAVRAAIHSADMFKWRGEMGTKYAGVAINTCARILNGMNRSYSNQVVCSRDFLDKISQPNRDVDAVRMPDTLDKHGHTHQVWNILQSPGFGIRPEAKHLYPDPNEWYLP